MMLQAFVMFALTAAGAIHIWPILVLMMVSGIANAVDIPARQTLVVEMVGGRQEDLGGAIALNSSIFNLGRAVGPAIAGVIVAAVGGADAALRHRVFFF